MVLTLALRNWQLPACASQRLILDSPNAAARGRVPTAQTFSEPLYV